MKPLLLISIALILLLLTAGCLDDLSSTLPPCCDGTCDGVKTSVITVITDYNIFSHYTYSIIDNEGIRYGLPLLMYGSTKQYSNHNVTFSYEMVNGHRHITGIIEDHDAKPKCDCCQCVQKCCGCE